MIGVDSRTSQTLQSAALQPFQRCARMRGQDGRQGILSLAMKLIDVSVPLDENLPTYPGNTPYSLQAVKRIARGDTSNVSTVHMSAHAGTHVDAPRHFFDKGAGGWALGLGILCGRRRGVGGASGK